MARHQTYYDPPQYGAVCPKCGSAGCQPITETKYKDGGFGVLSGICGYILLGPVGILCGFCGHESKYKTRTFWVCPSCGKKFKL